MRDTSETSQTMTAAPPSRRRENADYDKTGRWLQRRRSAKLTMQPTTFGRSMGIMHRKITAKPIRDKSIVNYFRERTRARAIQTLLDTSEVFAGTNPDADARLIEAVLNAPSPEPEANRATTA